ncbi:class II aldolase/adducin family protein [Streptomyces sp. NPDC057199]|uniref:class II aldolase/adducin family protein n=1 Tax=Streptomyces sp. NPDC057199 TaxID=3346047 RepID=UPI003624B8EF
MSDTLSEQLAIAARTLARLGLTTAFGHVSARSHDSILITPAADLATVHADDLIRLRTNADDLPRGAPAEARVHLAIYRARPDVHAISRAQPPAAAAAAAAAAVGSLPLLHGQAAWLGESIPIHRSAHLLRTPALAVDAANTLGNQGALLLRGNGAVTVGPTPGIATARMTILAAACQTWLSASASGTTTPLTDDEIASWSAVADELLPRLWAHLEQAGQHPRCG